MQKFKLHSVQISQHYVLCGEVEKGKNNFSLIHFQGPQDFLEYWSKNGSRTAEIVRFVINMKAEDFSSEDFLPTFTLKIPSLNSSLALEFLKGGISEKDCFSFTVDIPNTLASFSPPQEGNSFKVSVWNREELCGEETIALKEIPPQ